MLFHVRTVLRLTAVLMLSCLPALGQQVQKAVYFDEAYVGGGWITLEAGTRIRDFFADKGYKVLNAQELRTFMLDRINDGARSVIVFAKDSGPDTVCEALEGGGPAPNSTLRAYLNAGGRIVWAGDIPFYYQAGDGTQVTWGTNGSSVILGFNAAGGTWDLNKPAVITDAGKRWGLRTEWNSVRPAQVSAVDEVLAQTDPTNASAWVKRYVAGDNFGGFVRIIDHGLSEVTDDDFANMLAVAEYVPEGGPVKLGKISGTVKDASGNLLAGAVVVAVGPAGVVSAASDASGKYNIYGVAGTYTVACESLDSAPQTVTLTEAGVTLDFTGKALPSLTLSTAEGYSWRIWRGGALFDFAPADPGYKETPEWVDVEIPSDAEVRELNGAYFWYRTKINIPAEWANYKRGLIIDQFSVEDNDWTFFNGHFIGNMKWQTEGPRRYYVPTDWIVFGGENLLVVKGQHGNDTAGINRNPPAVHFASPVVGGVLVTVKEPGSGYPALNARVTLSTLDGKPKASDVVREAGYVMFGEVPAGDYKVTLETGPAVANTSPVTATVKVEPGRVAEVSLTPQILPLILPGDPSAYDDDFSGTTLDKKWTSVEIGDAGGSSAAVSNGTLVITAAGANIFGNSDNCHFVYQKIKGDFSVSVKVVSVPALHILSKAALMIRASEDPDAVNAVVYQSPTENQQYGCRFQWRAVKGDTTQGGTAGLDQPGTVAPSWLCLRREGKRVTAYFSQDGKSASLVAEGASVTIDNLPDEVLVGLAWASRGDMGEAVFDDFAVRPIGVVPPPAVVMGDITGDGKVGIPDATLALQIAVGKLQPTQAQLSAGDLNKNGRIDIPDVTRILRAAIGLEKLG